MRDEAAGQMGRAHGTDDTAHPFGSAARTKSMIFRSLDLLSASEPGESAPEDPEIAKTGLYRRAISSRYARQHQPRHVAYDREPFKREI